MSSSVPTSAQIRQSFLDFFKSKQHTVVASSSLMPDSPNLLFTNAGMNQFVPIFLGRVKCPYTPGRAADTQKCIRAGGKHNDLEDVGLDTYHHTFFEMLGNWSFGDYFKKEAIGWAWEFVIEKVKLPPHRLYATVYNPDKSKGDPSEFDQEAWDLWAEKFRSVGLDPAVHIVNGNKKDNFWMMGETGPCGPCTELHVDLTPAGDTRGALVNGSSDKCIEIWNNVFIQYNANPDGTFSPLPSQHVDTGMGFERLTSIIQCTKNFTDFNGIISNYETDVFRPLFDKLSEMSGKRYGSTLPSPDVSGNLVPVTEQEKVDVAFRVIADHIRTLSFSIADGISPGNANRNYVLRRILRRAVKYGRSLGFTEPFFYKLTDVLAAQMGDVFPEIRVRLSHVKEVLRVEEEAFNRTLDKGIALFESETAGFARGHAVSGAFAFRLYDEQGFPLDLTELLAREKGLTVDTAGFEKLMDEQRARARAAQKKEVIALSEIETKEPTHFVGFDHGHTGANVLEVIRLKDKTAVILDNTVCFAEMGGQVGDTGLITLNAQTWRITGTQKSGNTFLHLLEGDEAPEVGAHVTVSFDAGRRAAIQRGHSVTHLLHWALHEVVSKELSQKGSSVNDEKLTFDFNSAALTPVQVADIERLVNEKILENAPITWSEVPYASVKGRAGIMQFFGDKYGDTVRVVQVGGHAGKLDGYSMELCGGTHARATGEIGLFRIVSEAAVAAGVRRIEAVAGEAAYRLARAEADQLKALAAKAGVSVADFARKFDAILENAAAAEKQLKSYRQRETDTLANELAAKAIVAGGLRHVVAKVSVSEPNELKNLTGILVKKADVVVLGASFGDKASVAAQVSPEGVKAGASAGKIVSELAGALGGKGGGKPDFAMGGGALVAELDATLDAYRAKLR